MSTSARGRIPAEASGSAQVPIARPPQPAPPAASVPVPQEELDSPQNLALLLWQTFWTPASLKGWAGSVLLHTLLLLTLALWYFAPPLRKAIRFDSRLAGSPKGVPEGLTLTGGMNTPLAMPELQGTSTESVGDELLELKATNLAAFAAPARGLRPSGGGGIENTNPGAGEGDGFGLARFGEGGEMIRGVAVKVGDPQFTLIWDTDADLDLHVIEPGGKEIYWEEPKGRQGGELDVDNTKGLGPENIYWLVESNGPGSVKVKGPGPPGEYHWFVVYWGGFGGIPKPTHWKVRIKHDGKVTVVNGKFHALNERSRTFTVKLDPPRTTVRAGE